jgi:hypothetical protein
MSPVYKVELIVDTINMSGYIIAFKIMILGRQQGAKPEV